MDNPARIASCNICLLTKFKACSSCQMNPGILKLSPNEVMNVSRVELLNHDQIKELENQKECIA